MRFEKSLTDPCYRPIGLDRNASALVSIIAGCAPTESASVLFGGNRKQSERPIPPNGVDFFLRLALGDVSNVNLPNIVEN